MAFLIHVIMINNLEGEIWKPVREYKGKDYNGEYEVSNFGRVKSLKRGKEAILKQMVIKDGYKYINLMKNGRLTVATIHTLVWETFRFKRKDGYVVHHIDSNGFNNRLDNLAHITIRQNSSIEKTKKSGLPVGVVLMPNGRFRATISIKKKYVGLGIYDKIKDASKAYYIAVEATLEGKKTAEEIHILINHYRSSLGLRRLITTSQMGTHKKYKPC